MARMRTVKPEFWVDDKIVDLELLPKLLYIGIWNFADDDGYIKDSARFIKRQVFPDNDYDVQAAINALVSAGLLERCESDQGPLLYVPKLKAHQKPQHPTPTKFTNIRTPSGSAHEDSRNAHESSSGRGEESRGEESKGEVARSAHTIPKDFTLTVDMLSWAKENAPAVNPHRETENFTDYWRTGNGSGKRKKDWLATWKTWLRKAQSDAEARGWKPAPQITPQNEWMFNR